MKRSHFTDLAEDDFLQLWEYLSPFSEETADRTVDEIDRKTWLLAWNPGIGRRRPEIGAAPGTSLVYNYVIFYRAIEEGIEVVRVVDGRGDLRRIFS